MNRPTIKEIRSSPAYKMFSDLSFVLETPIINNKITFFNTESCVYIDFDLLKKSFYCGWNDEPAGVDMHTLECINVFCYFLGFI